MAKLKRLGTGFVLLAIVLLIGTLGYIWVEQLPTLRAFYSALLVVSTLGFGDFTPQTDAGIALTIALIFSGVGTLYYLLGTFAETLIETSLGTQQERRMERKIASMLNHYIICGYGRVGQHAARELSLQDRPFVIIDKDADAVETARGRGCAAILGDATLDHILEEAGIDRASGLLVTTASDAANVFITLTARSFNDQLLIVARASADSTESKLVKAGADKVIAPEIIGGQRMAALVLRPEATDVIDSLTLSNDDESWLDETIIKEDSPMCGLSLEAARVHTATGAWVIAIRHADGRLVTSPDGSEILGPGDVLISVGDHEQMVRMEHLARPGE